MNLTSNRNGRTHKDARILMNFNDDHSNEGRAMVHEFPGFINDIIEVRITDINVLAKLDLIQADEDMQVVFRWVNINEGQTRAVVFYLVDISWSLYVGADIQIRDQVGYDKSWLWSSDYSLETNQERKLRGNRSVHPLMSVSARFIKYPLKFYTKNQIAFAYRSLKRKFKLQHTTVFRTIRINSNLNVMCE